MTKILIIDDCNDKVKNISKLLIAKCGILDKNIIVASNATTGRKELKDNIFDILILDMNLPESKSEEPTNDGGLKFLDKIHTNQIPSYPESIIGITGFEDIFNDSKEHLEKYLLSLIHYDNSSIEWQKKIVNRVNYVKNVKQEVYGNCFKKFDIAVITALKDIELDAVLKLSYDWKEFNVSNDSTVNYHEGIVDGKYTIVIANAPSMGMVDSSVLTSKMCSHFHPRYFFMVGIAAGIEGKNEYGDILVAERSWDWGSGKITESFNPSHNQIELDATVISKIQKFKNNQSIFDDIKNTYSSKKPNTSLNLHIGAIASGSSVLSNKEEVANIQSYHRQLIGIEMEIYGVMSAIKYSTNPKPIAICMKSVCDFGDESKNDEWQEYAAYTSASMMDLLINELDFED